jgi:hypothetical protein
MTEHDLEEKQRAYVNVRYDKGLWEMVSTFQALLDLSDAGIDKLWDLVARAYLLGGDHAKTKEGP